MDDVWSLGATTEDDVCGLQRLVPPLVAPPSPTSSPRPAPSASCHRRSSFKSPRPVPGPRLQSASQGLVCGPDTAASSPLYRPSTRLAGAVGRDYNKTHVSLTVISHCHITRVNVQVSHDCDRVHSLQILTLLATGLVSAPRSP